MRLRPPRDLHRFRQAAHVRDIDPHEVGEAPFDEWQERPLAGQLLADGQRHIDEAPQLLVRGGVLGSDRLLDEVERSGRHPGAERRGLGNTQSMVPVDAQHRRRPKGIAQPHGPFRGECECRTWLEDIRWIARGRAGREPDDRPACRHQRSSVLDECRAHGRRGRCEQGHVGPLPSPQQLVHRYAQSLAADIVEGDIDGRDGRRQHPAAFEVLAPVQPLPDRAAGHGIGTDDQLPEVTDGSSDRCLARR